MHLNDIVANYLSNIKLKNNFFTIGISGNISSGKSSFAQYIKKELEKIFPSDKIEIISTDDFLFSNDYLQSQEIFHQKGWRNTYNKYEINRFFDQLIQTNKAERRQQYDQLIGDIIETKELIDKPTVLIIEGTMALTDLFLNYIDFSLFLDVDLEVNYNWFEKRSLANLSSKKEYCHLTENEAKKIIYSVWRDVNLKTFYQYILPNKKQANMCVDLDENHEITKIHS